MPLTAAEFERARTWMLEIAAAAASGVETTDEGAERRFRCNGGLLINRQTGVWYCHAAGRGGYSPVGLIQLLKSYSKAESVAWVKAFLANHPGTGTATGEDGVGYAESAVNKLRAEELLGSVVSVSGTPGEDYLRSRGIAPPYPSIVGFVADARDGEGALIGHLSAHDRVVGVQLTYLDPDGRKSLVQPTRRRFSSEKLPGAGFLLSGPPTGPTFICEGLEDALSLAMLGIGPVIGLPGIAALRHLELPKGTEVVVVRDGDETGSPADKGLIAGVDHLLLEGSTVKVTETPAGADANSILQSGGGTEALRQLIADAHTAELSLRGDITRLAKLDRLEYAGERKLTAKKHGIPVGTLDDEVKDEKGRQSAGVADDAPSQDEPAWDGPVPILADVLAWISQTRGASGLRI